uniref:von Willebrand factor A domain-containing protein 8-like n=1 Tax=Hirondellea gigas TaxID=1518452 RepID=A0A2P2I882_9CRUS
MTTKPPSTGDNNLAADASDTMNILSGTTKPKNLNTTNGNNKNAPNEGSIRIDVEALRNPLEKPNLQDIIHVVSVAPLTLQTLNPSTSLTRTLKTLSLHSLLPNLGGSHQPRLRLWQGTGGMVGLYEELTNTIMLADPDNGEVLQLNTPSFLDKVTLPLRQLTQQDVQNRCSSSGDALLVYTIGRSNATVVDTKIGKLENLDLKVTVENVVANGKGGWIVTDVNGAQWMIGGESGLDEMIPFDLHNDVSGEFKGIAAVPERVMKSALNVSSNIDDIVHNQSSESSKSSSVTQSDGNAGALLATNDTHANLLPGFPENDSGGLYSWYRQADLNEHKTGRKKVSQYDSHSHTRSIAPVKNTERNCVVLPNSGQIIQSVSHLPVNAPELLKTVPASGYLEVTDVSDRCVSYLPVPQISEQSQYWEWSVGRLAPNLMLAGGEGGIVSVDKAGGVRIWQVGGEALKSGMAEWLSMVGQGENERLEISKEGGDMSLDAPKHGKIDPKNVPHVGGNTWSGGTGGRDTAGLGGIGGPYRLDAGHDVHQVSDEVKAAVPREITEAARKMAMAAHKKRLKEIQMSEYDHDQYDKVSKNVRTQVNQMRAILSSLTAKAGERWWVKRRPDGELDDSALVDGLAGATNIYKQRQEIPPEAGQPQTKPKRLRLLLDASASMYRFNGHDNRLQRSMEAALMLMEACKGYESRLLYDIYGHSGEDKSLKFSSIENIPDDNKKRLDLLRTVLAHSQFCMAGDSTVSATKHAVDELAKTAEDSDQSFVVLLSDANLDRYGISPNRLAVAMTAQRDVQCYAVFIGSLGNQAKKLAAALPAGRAYVCLDVDQLPQIMQQIFTHAMTQ